MRTPSLLLSALTLLGACGPTFVAPDEGSEGRRTGDDVLPIEVLFSPHDDTLAHELEQIRSVVDARAADAATYVDGANPFRIRYGVYNLRNAAIVDALIDAEAHGVDVQVLMEDDQLDPARDWNWADEALIDAGFSFAPDHRELSPEERLTTDLIGIGGSGLMHLKSSLYETPAGATLITGSQNPGDNAMLNDESWHLVRDPALVDAYVGAYDAVLFETGLHNAWHDEAAWNVLFSPEASGPAAGDQLLRWLAEEDEQILLMVYSVRDLTAPGHASSLVEILGDRVAAGVPVVLITDRKQSDAWGDTTEDQLRDVGVHVYEATNATTEFTAMHHKTAVLGRTSLRVVTDAANWSTSGLGSTTRSASNVESSLFLEPWGDDGRLGARYLAAFVRTLERYAHQSEADGEPSYDELMGELMAHADWPTLDVAFVADEAHTSWGETIRVLGDHDALGAWGMAGSGVPLTTDAGSYPMWWADGTVALPIGATVRYKLVAEQAGSWRWESGADLEAFVQPAAFTEGTVLELRSSFR